MTKPMMAAALALPAGVMMMLALHSYGAPSLFISPSHFSSWHPMHAMQSGMGWMMVLGPVSMFLFFGGVLALLVAIVRWLSE